MSEQDKIAEVDAAFKLGRWVYVAAMIGLMYLFDEEQKAHAYVYGLSGFAVVTHCGDLFITWLRLKQRHAKASPEVL